MKDWGAVLVPEYNVKGLLCNGIYSSLAEVLNLSIGAHGVQAKTVNGHLVPFRTTKGTKLHTISVNKNSWALDIAKFFGCSQITRSLADFPGLLDEDRIKDMICSIRGIAETLGVNNKLPSEYYSADELLQKIKNTYLQKMKTAAASSKFDKAKTEMALSKAAHTKSIILNTSQEIADLII
jgi:hypothetical protein